MPRHSKKTPLSQRLNLNIHGIDLRRFELIESILDESSSISLNDVSNQQNARQTLEQHSRLLDMIDELKQMEKGSTIKLPKRDEASWKRFFHWIDREHECESTSSALSQLLSVKQIGDVDADEYSLTTKVPVKKGDKVFGVSRRLLLSTETALSDTELLDFVKTDSIASTMQNVVLVLHLLNEYSKGSHSYWAPYLSTLPSKLLPVLNLDREQLKHLLASSYIFEVLKMIRAISRQYTYFFRRLQTTNLPLRKDFTYEYYCWAVSIVCSRQNEIPPRDRKSCSLPVIHALLPVVDMCNHDQKSNQATYEANESRLYANKDLAENDEITINYGIRTSGDFYIHNGFVPDEVPTDSIPLAISLNQQGFSYATRKELLKTLNMPTHGKFKLMKNVYENRHKRDPHLTMFLIVNLMKDSELGLIVDDDNPVGVADDIYEYVHHKHYESIHSPKKSQAEPEALDDKNQDSELMEAKKRLCNCVPEYLTKRARIGLAMIDRVLAEIDSDQNLRKLLTHEADIYRSYLTN